jgi:hypothetical protein
MASPHLERELRRAEERAEQIRSEMRRNRDRDQLASGPGTTDFIKTARQTTDPETTVLLTDLRPIIPEVIT